MSSFVHPFSTFGAHYLYDVNTSCILRVPQSLHEYFDNGEKGELDEHDKHLIERLREAGFLNENPIVEIQHPYTSRLPALLDRRVENLTLQVTQQCNLRCKYCIYSGSYINRGHSEKRMSFDVAKKCIDFLFAHSIDLDHVNIGFYGGEPLLEFELIKKIVAYVSEAAEGKEVSYSITTNGTVFTDEKLKFLAEQKIAPMISLDGPKEIQDKNRVFANNGKGTFDTIMSWVRKIKEEYPEMYRSITFNAVIDPRLDVSCSSSFFISSEEFEEATVKGNLIGISYKKKAIDYPEKFIVSEEEEHFKVLMNKVGVVSDKSVSRLATGRFEQAKGSFVYFRNISRKMAPQNHPSGPCIPGARKLFADVYGNFYPCESASESSAHARIGNVDDGFDLAAAERLLNVGKVSEKECKRCWGFRLCAQCCIHADDGKSLSRKKRLEKCSNILFSNEEALKDYCTMLEYGHKFHSSDQHAVFNYEG